MYEKKLKNLKFDCQLDKGQTEMKKVDRSGLELKSKLDKL